MGLKELLTLLLLGVVVVVGVCDKGCLIIGNEGVVPAVGVKALLNEGDLATGSGSLLSALRFFLSSRVSGIFILQSALGEFLGEQPPRVRFIEEKAWKYCET